MIDAVAVVIPARDEGATIEVAVASTLTALGHPELRGLATLVVVVADSCTDDTSSAARRALRPTDLLLVRAAGSAGGARRAGTDAALEWWSGGASRLWLAHTDADTAVPPDWLSRQLVHARGGVGCVAGLVDLNDPTPTLGQRFRGSYDLGVGAKAHRHVHGANMGMLGSLYTHLGGWSPLATGEDVDLWRRAVSAGARHRHDPDLVVTTSARTEGRAPDGFARDLRQLLRVDPAPAGPPTNDPWAPATAQAG